MLDSTFFDDIAKRLANLIPPGAQTLKTDLQQNFRSILQSAFAKLDLVTREEFDAQAGVLGRTRAKLDKLEAQVAELEKQHLQQSGTSE